MTAKVIEETVETYPVLTRDGTLNGVVRYYGAVGAGAEYPYLAYEFLKHFLSLEAQHETYMTSRYYNRANESACIGWPVRVVGSAQAHSVNRQTFLDRNSDSYTLNNNNRIKRLNRLLKDDIVLMDEDMPLVFQQVDRVIFPVPMESVDSLVGYRTKMFDPETGKGYPDVNYEALAQGYIDEMILYLQEG